MINGTTEFSQHILRTHSDGGMLVMNSFFTCIFLVCFTKNPVIAELLGRTDSKLD